MKRITTLLGLVVWTLLTLPMPSAGATGASAPPCPLEADYVVELTSDYLLGWKDSRRSLGPFPGLVPAGEYQLELVSWDDHSSKPHQDHVQPQEVWFLSALDAAGVEVVRTANTPDLAGDLDLAVFDMGTVVVAADAVSFTAFHGFHDDWNPNSVSPLCAGFTSRPQTDSPATAAPAEGEPVPPEEAVPVPPASNDEPAEATSQLSPSETAVVEETALSSAAPGVASPPSSITAAPVPAAVSSAEPTPAPSQAEEPAPIAPASRAAAEPAGVTAAPVPAAPPLSVEMIALSEPAWLPLLLSPAGDVAPQAPTRVMGIVVPGQVTELPATGVGLGGLSALALILLAAGLMIINLNRFEPGTDAG